MLAVTPSNMLNCNVQEALDGTGLEPVGGTERLLAAASGSSILQSAVEEVTRVSIQVSNMILSAELTCYSPREELLALIFTRLPYRTRGVIPVRAFFLLKIIICTVSRDGSHKIILAKVSRFCQRSSYKREFLSDLGFLNPEG
jgi:hypothetical protein